MLKTEYMWVTAMMFRARDLSVQWRTQIIEGIVLAIASPSVSFSATPWTLPIPPPLRCGMRRLPENRGAGCVVSAMTYRNRKLSAVSWLGATL